MRIGDQRKVLFELKIMNVIRCINCNNVNYNEELGSSISYPYHLSAEQISLIWIQCYGCFLRPSYIKVQKNALSAVALAIYINWKS